MHDIRLTESFISSEISTERNSFLPSNKSCKSPLVTCKRVHSEQNALLCARGRISQGLSFAMLGVSPGLSVAMDLTPTPKSQVGERQCSSARDATAPKVLLCFLQPRKRP